MEPPGDTVEEKTKREREADSAPIDNSNDNLEEDAAIEDTTPAVAIDESEAVKHNSNKNAHDPFLSSMTFAASGGTGAARGGCECDDCGPGGGLFTPQAIIDAIRKHKRQRHEYQPMKRTQQRELVQRHGPISVYKLTMPLDADPLVEFGTAHRLIWIQSLSDTSTLKTIGKGIVGSQDEEGGRQELTLWKQGGVYLVPSNGGKAVAWLHNNNKLVAEGTAAKAANTTETEALAKIGDSNNKEEAIISPTKEETTSATANNGGGGHAILYVCKIPKDSLLPEATSEPGNGNNTNDDNVPEWRRLIHSICLNGLDSFENENKETKTGFEFQKVAEESSALLREALSGLS